VTLPWLQLDWIHAISQSALAAAVGILGLVILLELRSIKMLRRAFDAQLGRVFEQLDLMRFERQQPVRVDALAPLVQAAEPAPAGASSAAEPLLGGNAYAAAAALASTGMSSEEIAQRCGLGAGEARLLASMAAARSRRGA
jgi:hypothetical protein